MKSRGFSNFFIAFLAVCAGLAVVSGFVVIYYFFTTVRKLRDSPFTVDNETMGMIGEFFGGTVGSIWAFAGIILFYLALIYQRRELEYQREELKETRTILMGQSETIAIQQFDNTFFQLLNFHIDASRKFQAQGNVNGFDQLYKDFVGQINNVKRKRKVDRGAQILDDEVYKNSFRAAYDGYKNTLQLYFESYKTLVNFIEDKSHDPGFYFNVIKTHWSEQESIIQFYYVLFYSRSRKLKGLIEKYGLFQGLNQAYISKIEKSHLGLIKASAYKGKD